jgi:hypothetical protein
MGDALAVGATTHITVGTAGIGFDNPEFVGLPWSLVRFNAVYAYSRVTVVDANTMTFTLIDSMNGTVLDNVNIVSNHSFAYYQY